MIKFGQNVYREHYLFRLPDGFRVSVAKGYYSTYGGDKGFWEMALLNPKGGIDYEMDEDIFGGDVLGYLTDGEVEEILAELKGRHKECITITNTVILKDGEIIET